MNPIASIPHRCHESPPHHLFLTRLIPVVISLDRCFIARIASCILIFRGKSKLTFLDGNYFGDEEGRRKTLSDTVTRPHRITYRELSR